MTALNFPPNPTLNEPHTENGQTWIFNGFGWVNLSNNILNTNIVLVQAQALLAAQFGAL